MVRVVDCHTGVLGSNPGRPKRISPWNYFTGGSGNSVAPESASGSSSGLYSFVVGARLSENKKGKSVVGFESPCRVELPSADLHSYFSNSSSVKLFHE